MDIGLFTSGSTYTITDNCVHTSGHSQQGIGAAGYVYDASISSAEVSLYPMAMFLDATGRGFRLAEPYPELAMFGCIPNWKGYVDNNGLVVTQAGGANATSNAVNIQHALNYVHDYGSFFSSDVTDLRKGGVLHIVGKYTYTNYIDRSGTGDPVVKPIIIPPDVSLQGSGTTSAWLVRTDTTETHPRVDFNNQRAIIWGTYGPGISATTSPQAEIKYKIADAHRGDSDILFLTPSDAGNFVNGSIIYIDGGRALMYNTGGLYPMTTPNVLRRVIKSDASTGWVRLDEPLDDEYVASASYNPGARVLNNQTVTSTKILIDATGRQWTLFVATGTFIRDLTLVHSIRVGWPNLLFACFEFTMSNVNTVGDKYWGGNPGARGVISDCHWLYNSTAVEVAYGCHDVVWRDCSARRVQGGRVVDPTPLVWTNSFEGAKRQTFERFRLYDDPVRSGSGDLLAVAWALDASRVIQSRSESTAGGVGYFRGGSFVSDSEFIANRTATIGGNNAPSVQANASDFINNVVTCPTGTGSATVLVIGAARVADNDIGPATGKTASDIIRLNTDALLSVLYGNRTYAQTAPYPAAIRNPTLLGAVVGSPGVLPFQWSLDTIATGLVSEVVSLGADDTGPYITVRVSGTATSTATTQFAFEPQKSIEVASGNNWRTTVPILVNALTGTAGVIASLLWYNSSGVFMTATSSSIYSSIGETVLDTGPRAALGSKYVRPCLRFDVISGAVVDVSIRIYAPTLNRWN